MDLRCLIILLVSVYSIDSEDIDYKIAAEIFKAAELLKPVTENLEDDVITTRSSYEHFANPVSKFINFMRDHGKVYSSKQDLFKRKENFIANIEKSEDFQSLDRGSAQYSINKFFDYSDDDFNQLIGLHENTRNNFFQKYWRNLRTKINSFFAEFGFFSNDHAKKPNIKPSLSVPKAVDWRKKGVISRVKYQGDCSSCWAFSALGVVEAMHAIQRRNLTQLSVQQLVDCDNENEGCNGGTMDVALQYIIDADGVVSEKDYPYIGVSHSSCLKRDDSVKFKVKEYKRIPYGDEESMKEWVATYGPLSVGVNVQGLFYYVGGVMDLSKFWCNPDDQNHALLVVGYGEEKRKGKQTIPYWIVKNSWGEDWGEKGYFRIRRGTNSCGIGAFVHGAIVK